MHAIATATLPFRFPFMENMTPPSAKFNNHLMPICRQMGRSGWIDRRLDAEFKIRTQLTL